MPPPACMESSLLELREAIVKAKDQGLHAAASITEAEHLLSVPATSAGPAVRAAGVDGRHPYIASDTGDSPAESLEGEVQRCLAEPQTEVIPDRNVLCTPEWLRSAATQLDTSQIPEMPLLPSASPLSVASDHENQLIDSEHFGLTSSPIREPDANKGHLGDANEASPSDRESELPIEYLRSVFVQFMNKVFSGRADEEQLAVQLTPTITSLLGLSAAECEKINANLEQYQRARWHRVVSVQTPPPMRSSSFGGSARSDSSSGGLVGSFLRLAGRGREANPPMATIVAMATTGSPTGQLTPASEKRGLLQHSSAESPYSAPPESPPPPRCTDFIGM